MKKLLIMIPTLMAVQMSHAGTQLFLGNSGSNLNSVIPGAQGGGYYKCNNSVAFSCQSDYISIEYGSMSGGSGTPTSPYILTNCSFISCACGYKYYLSGKTCVACDFDAMVAPDVSVIHANTSASACAYCSSSMLKTIYRPAPGVELTKCIACPSNGTCDGSSTLRCNAGYYGSTSCTQCPLWSGIYTTSAKTTTVRGTCNAGSATITNCYIPSGTYYDTTGTFKINTSNVCPYIS